MTKTFSRVIEHEGGVRHTDTMLRAVDNEYGSKIENLSKTHRR
jgi:hypothetical protein